MHCVPGLTAKRDAFVEMAYDKVHTLLSLMMHIPFFGFIVSLLYKRKYPSLQREVCGITFPNPLGLGGGVDINGEYFNRIADAGFGFVEFGSVTPRPQEGRLPNKGLKYALNMLRKNHPKAIIGANICKNTNTSSTDAPMDYERCLALLYDLVDMFIVNISSPTSSSIYELQEIDNLAEIVDKLLSMRMYFNEYRPIFIKISPDNTRQQLDDIVDYCLRSGVDGIVACNLSRDGSQEELFQKSLKTVKYIREKSRGLLPIIGSGGIRTPEQALEMLESGASLIEICTAFVTEGPSLVRRTLKYLDSKSRKQ